MRKLLFILTFVLLAFFMTSCGFSKMMAVTDGTSLTQANFKIVGTATGKTTATLVFGIGGLSRRSQAHNAIVNMYKSVNLKPNQTITNIAVSQTNRVILGIVCNRVTFATGQIIEFVPSEVKEVKEEKQTELPNSWYSY